MFGRNTLFAILVAGMVCVNVRVVRADQIDQNSAPTANLDIPLHFTQWEGETFAPSLPFLTGAEWGDLDGSNGLSFTAGQVITAQIWTASTSVITDVPGFIGDNRLVRGTKLGEATRTAPIFASGGGQYSGKFDLGFIDVSPYVNVPGSLVVLFEVTDNGQPSNFEAPLIIAGDKYTRGSLFITRDQGNLWTDGYFGPTYDLKMRTYGSSVPEPASLALLVPATLLRLRRSRVRA